MSKAYENRKASDEFQKIAMFDKWKLLAWPHKQLE